MFIFHVTLTSYPPILHKNPFIAGWKNLSINQSENGVCMYTYEEYVDSYELFFIQQFFIIKTSPYMAVQ